MEMMIRVVIHISKDVPEFRSTCHAPCEFVREEMESQGGMSPVPAEEDVRYDCRTVA